MAIAKSDQEIKRQVRRDKRAKIDKLTNRYMINLCWGILGIVLLRFIESSYGLVLAMPTILKSLAAVFALVAVGLFICGKKGVIKNTSRAYHYSAFSAVVALITLWIAFFAPIRLVFCKILPFLQPIDSRWWYSWGIIVLLIAYLILSLIWTAIRIKKIEKSRTA